MESKAVYGLFSVVTAGAVAAAVFAGSLALATQPGSTPKSALAQETRVNTISVQGDGKVLATPDRAFITVGVLTQAPTALEAQQQNATTMSAVVARIKSQGIADKDIRTSGLTLSPVYDRNDSSKITAYRAQNNVTVTIDDLTQVGKVFDEAVAAGATQGGNIRFAFKNDEQFRQQALEDAVKNARTKADAMARTAGVTIKGVQTIAEINVGGGPVPVDRAAPVAAPAQGVAPTPVSPGEQALTARVQVTFIH
ncbi:MAG: SIMPL domain-containing protein [Chloroflexi bacterium]|nr:SIMPL domain-containing protein [Chloroflexota bacterium]